MRISDWSSDVCSSDLLRVHSVHVTCSFFQACALIIDMLLRVGSRRCQASSERDMARSPLKKRSGNAAEDIVRAAERLFGEDGVSLVSLRQIAIAANQVNNLDRKSVVSGKSVTVRVYLGGRGSIKQKT